MSRISATTKRYETEEDIIVIVDECVCVCGYGLLMSEIVSEKGRRYQMR